MENSKIKNNEIAKVNGNGAVSSDLITSLVLNGDIGKMTDEMKVKYYNQLCHSLGLNPVTRPFQLINFQGKSVLYATKDCTEQLRKINGVSVIEMTQDIKDGLCITKCKVQDNTGRFDIATGVTVTAGIKAGDLANAIMKSETKAKRRATLSICGLGILDESELDTMPKYETSEISNVTVAAEDNPFILMAAAKNIEEVKVIWTNNKALQKDAKFIELKEQKKKELSEVTVNDLVDQPN